MLSAFVLTALLAQAPSQEPSSSAPHADSELKSEWLEKDVKLLERVLRFLETPLEQVGQAEPGSGLLRDEVRGESRDLGLGFHQDLYVGYGGYTTAYLYLVSGPAAEVVKASLVLQTRCGPWRALQARLDLTHLPPARPLDEEHEACVVEVAPRLTVSPDTLDLAFARHFGVERRAAVPSELWGAVEVLALPFSTGPLARRYGYDDELSSGAIASARLAGKRELLERILVSPSPEGRLFALAALRPHIARTGAGRYAALVKRIAALKARVEVCYGCECVFETPSTPEAIFKLLDSVGY